MEDGLARPRTVVDHRPVTAVFQTLLPRQLRGHNEHPAKQMGIVGGRVLQCRQVLSRNNEDVDGRLVMGILKPHDLLILENNPGGQASFYNPAEDALIHVSLV